MELEAFQVLKEWRGKTIVEILSLALSISKGAAKKLLDEKKVFLNNKRIWMAKHLPNIGDAITVSATNKKDNPLRSLSVLHEDDWILIVNKPAGVLSNGEKSVEKQLRHKLQMRALRAVHRLDRDTTGALLFCKTQEAWDAMYKLFADRTIEKRYHVLCVGRFEGKKRTIKTPIDGKEALSEVFLKEQYNDISLLEVIIHTGRTHQIRKHLLSIGLPVLGDKEYVTKRSTSEKFRSIDRQMLHAFSLSFQHPFTNVPCEAIAPYPHDFNRLLN